MSENALHALAALAGLDSHWTDISGNHHTVSDETLRSILGALGLSAENDTQIDRSRRELEERERALPPLITAWTGETLYIQGHTLTAPDTPGYYQVKIGDAERTLAVAPPRCFGFDDLNGDRFAGMGVQLYGLRGGHTAAFGDFAALGEIAREAGRRSFDAIAVSPTHALFLAEPRHRSPYSPSSRVFSNPLFADAALFGAEAAHDDGADGLIDWPSAAARKLSQLRRAFVAFAASHDQTEFRAFCEKGGERLKRHAIFETLDAHFRAQCASSWRSWPTAYRDATSSAIAEFAREHSAEVDFHLFLQFLSSKSAAAAQGAARHAGMKIGMISDIATGVDPAGSDCWGAPDDVLLGLSIGAPPDYFNAEGQGWGVTALSPRALRDKGFDLFIAMLRASMAHAGGVRIDHVMSLMRLWVIPDGAKPLDGAYLRYPVEDLFRLTTLESYLNRAIVIGEDLGTVPYGFRDILTYRGLAGMQVLWFEREGGGFIPRGRWRRESLAMTTTHDLPTIAGWWRGTDIGWRAQVFRDFDAEAETRGRDNDRRTLWWTMVDAGCASGEPPVADDAEPAIQAALRYIGGAPSRLALCAVEDVLGLTEQPNLPSTIDEHPNWRRRLPPGPAFSAEANKRAEIFVSARRNS
jgi:4-alpha-glucanotransferase